VFTGCGIKHWRCCLQTASSVLYATTCKHSLLLLRMGEIIAANMLSCLKLLIKLLLLHLVGYFIIVRIVSLSATILVVPAIHRYVLLPLGLYHEFRGSRFLRNEGSYLANVTASHRTAQHKLRSISCNAVPRTTSVIKKKKKRPCVFESPS